MSSEPIPFPALTPTQRLHIDIYGYVIIKNLLTEKEIAILKDTLYGMEEKQYFFTPKNSGRIFQH